MNDLYSLLDYATMLKNKKRLKKELLESKELIEKRIAILCGSTFGQIKDFLELFLLYNGIKPSFWEGDYDRFYEEACFENDSLAGFQPDFIFVHITNKNLLINSDISGLSYEQIHEEEKKRLKLIWTSLSERYHCCIIQNNFEYFPYRVIGNASKTSKNGNVRYVDDLNAFITEYALEHPEFLINDIHYMSSYVGLTEWYDERMWHMYKCPMAMSVMPRYALSIASIVKSMLGRNKKAIITDLDNTLWGGIIGEDGAEGILLGGETPQGEAYAELHRYIKQLGDYGILLNICSKNDYEIGIGGLKLNRSVLCEEDFLVKKINWDSKPKNVGKIMKELNILPDSVIFLDDSAMECEAVKAIHPNIEVMQAVDSEGLIQQLDWLSFFEGTRLTREDVERNRLYKEGLIRTNEQQMYDSYEQYLKSLNMVSRVSSVNKDNVQRVVQLFNKTNQFNFATNRYTLEEMNQLCEKKNIDTIVLDLEDRFGNNGIVSVSILQCDADELHIRDWIMSCRVFGRGLEYFMLDQICRRCLKIGVNTLSGIYTKTSKNIKLEKFYEELEFEFEGGKWICRDILRLLDFISNKFYIKESV